jgi:hypothetical protein
MLGAVSFVRLARLIKTPAGLHDATHDRDRQSDGDARRRGHDQNPIRFPELFANGLHLRSAEKHKPPQGPVTDLAGVQAGLPRAGSVICRGHSRDGHILSKDKLVRQENSAPRQSETRVEKIMKFVKVDSSLIDSIAYDRAKRVLFVSMALYQYEGVRPGVYLELVTAESHGEVFHRRIRSDARIKFRRLLPTDAAG